MTNSVAYLSGKHAVVTGGNRGIGAAIAESLARLGANVTIMSRSSNDAQNAAHTLQQFGTECRGIACDVSDAASVHAAFAAARDELGAPYVLVNNAGLAESAALEETTADLWNRLIGVNLTGTLLCTQQVLPAMRSSRAGRIINIASTAGLKGYSHSTAYCASKHGVVGFTRALAVETAKLGITVNAVCPGYTDTAIAQGAIETLMDKLGKTYDEARQMLTRGNPRGVLTTPAEVANTVAWLCSPDATAITGQSIAVANGEVM